MRTQAPDYWLIAAAYVIKIGMQGHKSVSLRANITCRLRAESLLGLACDCVDKKTFRSSSYFSGQLAGFGIRDTAFAKLQINRVPEIKW